MKSNCFYCNISSESTLNGIDRMDSNKGYKLSNCVSCCKTCNFIKGSLDPMTFINRCQHISKSFDGNGCYFPELFSNSVSVPIYKNYRQRAVKKRLDYSLTEEDFNNIFMQSCYYCSKENSQGHRNGIDRKNNNIGYTIENCVSCCKECNYMKGSLSHDSFIEKCKNISNYTLQYNVVVTKINQCLNKITKREKQDFENTKIKITSQEPKPPKQYKPIVEYIPKQREYVRKNNLPENCRVKNEDIPKYCYYLPETDKRGDGFCCDRKHPKQEKNNLGDYKTSQSKKISTEDKFKQLLAYIQS